jgi:hypothetical protein
MVATRTRNAAPAPFSLNKFEVDALQSLYSLIQDYKDGTIKKAPHQREFKWTKQKVIAWNKDIIGAVTTHYNSRPTGCFVTYQVPDDSNIYLNDGFQRLTASSFILQDPKFYGVPPEQAAAVLKAYNMTVQHRIFDNHFEALLAFQKINYGTPLTGYEFCAGFLMDVPNSTTNWHDTLEELHNFLAKQLAPFKGPNMTHLDKADNKTQYALRQNYALFTRFLTRNKTLSGGYAQITTAQPPNNHVEERRTVEQVLRLTMDSLEVDRVLNELAVFKKLISNELETITGILQTVNPEMGKDLTRVTIRFLLHVALWRRNNSIPDDAWKLFVLKFFRNMSVPNQIDTYKDGILQLTRISVSEGKLTGLSHIGNNIGFDITQVERMPRNIGSQSQATFHYNGK